MASAVGTADEAASWGDLVRSGHVPLILTLSFGIWLHAADDLMVSTLSPSLVAELGGVRLVAWLTGLYQIGAIVAGAAAARAVEGLGAGRAAAFAAALYGTGCVVSALAPTMEIVLAGRLLQGLGGGGMIAVAFVTLAVGIADTLLARVFALISIVWGVSAFSGPMVGALFVEWGHWRWAFAAYGAQALLYVVLALRLLPMRRQVSGSGFPWRIGLLALGALAVTFAGTRTSALEVGLLAAAGLALIALFVWLDGRKTAGRLLPPRASNPFSPGGTTMWVVLLLPMATMALITYGPLTLSHLHGLSALAIGAILLLESVGWSISAVLVSGLPARHDATVIACGFAIAMLAVGVMALTIVDGPLVLTVLAALGQGFGFGMAWTFLTRRARAMVPPEEVGVIAGAIPTVQRLGYALGAAGFGAIANASGFVEGAEPARLADSARLIFAAGIVPAVAGLAVLTAFLRRPAGRSETT